MTTPTPDFTTNPYVGPRTFTSADRKRFFGREAEAAGLLARVVSERLLLFYAQSGAGKSSLINARLIPQLREEEGFSVLPVGRVAGQLPAGVAQVDNIFLFNLMAGLDGGGGSPAQWAHLGLNEFLEHLVTDDGLAWRYDPAAATEPAPAGQAALPDAETGPAPRFALVIDQFEEIITGHPDRWREREGFFRQLDAALQADPNLWVVLSLREDYVAALDPYAPLVFNRLRARFYMERMGVAAGLEAIRKPAELAGRSFAEGVAEQLADNLRQVRVPGQEATVAGQYVEPVQLQVVCYQLWENIKSRPAGLITATDLHEAGDVNRALTQFYEETLAAALADWAASGVSERQLRAWFDEKLITDEGTRGLAHQGESDAGGLPNGVVQALQRRFLVRAEARGSDTWIELVHDRFVEPIRASNAAWFPLHLSALQRQAALSVEQGLSSGLLLRDAALAEAETWAASHEKELQRSEREFLDACRLAQKAAERERRQSRRIRILAAVAVGVALVSVVALYISWLQGKALRAQGLVTSARLVLEEAGDEELAALLSVEANRIDHSLGYEVWDAIAKREFPGNWKPLRFGEEAEDQGGFSWSPNSQYVADARIGSEESSQDYRSYLTGNFLIEDMKTFESRVHIAETFPYTASLVIDSRLRFEAWSPQWSNNGRYVAFGYLLPDWYELRIWDNHTIASTLLFTATTTSSVGLWGWESENDAQWWVLLEKPENAVVVRAWKIVDGSVDQMIRRDFENPDSAEAWIKEQWQPTPVAPREAEPILGFHNTRFREWGKSEWPLLGARDYKEGSPMAIVWDEQRQTEIRALPLPFSPPCVNGSLWSPDGQIFALDTCAPYVVGKTTPFKEGRTEQRVLTFVHVKSLVHPCDWVTRNLTEDEWIKYFGMVPNRSTCDNLPSTTRSASFADFSDGFEGALYSSSQYLFWLGSDIREGKLRSSHGRVEFAGSLSLFLVPFALVLLLLGLVIRRIKKRVQHKVWLRKTIREAVEQQKPSEADSSRPASN